MNKIITSFEKFNESKHAKAIVDSKENIEKDQEFFDDAKKVLADAKKYKLKDAESKSFFSKLEEDIEDLADCIKKKNKSAAKLALTRVKSGIEKCDFK
jgi:hypothetical protein